jgi:glucose/arabinose dehydrogenase
MTISAKATPITIPKFLERAKKLEARPTLSRGKEPMMALLLAGLKRLIPMPSTTCLHRMSKSLTPCFKRVKEKTVNEVRVKPMVAGILAPTRSENLPQKGAMTITVRATGKMSMPTLDGENSKIFCRKKGRTKVWAAFIQKERKLVPREETKSRLLNKLRSIKGKGDRSSTMINRLKQSKLEKSHPHRRGSDP